MLRTSRLGFGVAAAALVFSLASTIWTRPRTVGAAQGLAGSKTRLALVDSGYIMEKVRADGAQVSGGEVEADLEAFGSRLNAKLIDVAKLSSTVLVVDHRLNVSDAFVSAFKAKPNRAARLDAPAINVPDAYVAFVETEAFGDARTGIKRLTDAFKVIEKEFKPRREEVQILLAEAEAASGDRKKKLEAEAKQKKEAGQAALNIRLRELTNPINEDIMRALLSFSKQHGISLVFDLSKMDPTHRLHPYNYTPPHDTPDLTKAFISAYNKGQLKP